MVSGLLQGLFKVWAIDVPEPGENPETQLPVIFVGFQENCPPGIFELSTILVDSPEQIVVSRGGGFCRVGIGLTVTG